MSERNLYEALIRKGTLSTSAQTQRFLLLAASQVLLRRSHFRERKRPRLHERGRKDVRKAGAIMQ